MTGYNDSSDSGVKTAATISLLAGAWLFVSPWIYRAESMHNAWNSWIVGALIVILAAVRISNPLSTRGISVINMLLGAWVFASPWIYGYMHTRDRLFNSLCVGAVVFIASAIGSSMGHTHTTVAPPPLRP